MTKVTLVTTKWCAYCPAAKKLWQGLKQKYNFEYEEVDATTPEGQKLAAEFKIMAVPTTIVDGKVAFIGIPNKEKAEATVKG